MKKILHFFLLPFRVQTSHIPSTLIVLLGLLAGQALEKSYDFACELIIDNPQYAGFYIESAAYNPSLSPLHTMLINLWADGGAWSDIEEVLLVEHEDAVVSQQCFAKSMQEKVFPGAKLSVHYFSNDK